MKTEAELIKHVEDTYLKVSDEEHRNNMLTMIYAAARLFESERIKGLPDVATLVEAKLMLLVHAYREKWGAV